MGMQILTSVKIKRAITASISVIIHQGVTTAHAERVTMMMVGTMEPVALLMSKHFHYSKSF